MARLMVAAGLSAVTGGTLLVAGPGWALIVGGVAAVLFGLTVEVDGGR